jgi:cytosine/adenosine deaminase-related metal-dependent hydrolase
VSLPDLSFDPRATVRAGAVNAHTHLYSGLAPLGMPPPARTPKDFVEILQLVWWKLDRALDEQTLRASARLYLAEALLAGCTTVIDHHESPHLIAGSLDLLAEEATALGARLLVTYGATERNGGRAEATAGLAECARFIKSSRASGRFPLVRGVVGLHASFTVSDETVREAGSLAADLGVPLHVHVAEDQADVADARTRGYPGPLERLHLLGALPRGSLLAHGVWLGEDQVRAADAAGAWLLQNPRSNANNRVGWPRALSASAHVAIGTDGFPAAMEDEHAALASEAVRNADPLSEAVLAARRSGAHALAESLWGVRFDARQAEGSAGDLVLGVPGERPRHVLVGGRSVVRDGALVHGDLEQIRAHAREQAARLWGRVRG